ncbi:MAG: BatD family protein [Chitinispirillaceae bacterium]|nr:BatD family protein [Chitinispirillaceae bacterium]
MKRSPVLIVVLCAAMASFAGVRFTVTTDHTNVVPGEQVVVVAELVTDNASDEVAAPAAPRHEAFDCIKTDRRQSSSTSIQIINGKASQTKTVTTQFYYVIVPKKTGAFTFPSLEVTVDGTPYTTQPLAFNAASEPVKNPDVHVTIRLSKQPLYVGEQAILTLKVAQRGNSPTQVERGFNGVVAALEKSFPKDLSLSRLFRDQVATSSERIGGEMYRTAILRWAVIPLAKGSFSIPAVPFEYAELKQSRRRSLDPFFGDFFGGDFFGGGMQAVGRTAFSNTLAVRVKELPPAPAGFSGSIGKITLSASIDPPQVPAGDAATLKVLVHADTRPGNVSDVTVPALADCEIFTPEKNVQVDTTANGIVSKKSYKYLLIPQKEGTLAIPPIELSYFDPHAGTYKTASTQTLSCIVTKGKGGAKQQTRYLTQEEIREVGSDIRYIKTGVRIRSMSQKPYREPVFYLLYPLPFLIVVAAILYRVQSRRREANALLLVRRRALKSALKTLNELKKRDAALKTDDFLGRIADVIERYISHKFGFPATGRTLEELKAELLERHAQEKIVSDLTAFIELLDSYRFGGAAFDEKSRSSVLDQASAFLFSLEKTAKGGKKKTPGAMPVSLLAVALLGSAPGFSAPVDHWFDRGNHFYAEQRYDSAIVYYENVVSAGISSPAVYFNLGNAYFRQKKLGLARLCYEKAARLDPADRDIAANIRFVSSNIVDRVPEPQRGFIETLFWQVHVLLSLTAQLWFCFILLMVLALLVSIALFVRGTARLWCIYVSSLLSLLLLLSGLSMGIKIYHSEKVEYAILLEQRIDAKNEPDGAKIIFTAHEGTKFLIRKTVEGWSLVSLPNGLSGWVENRALGKI